MVAFLAVTAAGCGESDEEPATQAERPAGALPTPTKQEFRKASAEICARTDKEIAAFIPLGSDPTTRHNSRVAIIRLIREQIADLRALGFPPGSRDELEPLYRDIERALDRAAADDAISIEDEIDEAVRRHPAAEEYSPGCSG